MTQEDLKIQIIKGENSFTAFLNHKDFQGIVVQVNELKDVPKELAKSFEAMLDFSFENGNFEINEL